MSDELAIQPQIIEPRKKDNSLGYGTAGAIVGAGAGWAANRYLLNGAKNLSDLAADATSKDKVELSSKYTDIESASIDDLTAKAQALKDAEAKLAEASQAGLPADAKEVTEFNEAKKAFDEAYQKAYDAEIAKHKPSGKAAAATHEFAKITIDPNAKEFEISATATADEKKAANESLKEALKKKGIRGEKKGSLAEQFRRDFKELIDAREEVEAQLKDIKDNRLLGVAEYDTKLMKLVDPSPSAITLEGLTDDKFNELLSKTETVDGKIKKIFRPDRLGKLAKEIAKDEITEISTSATSLQESVLKELCAKEGKAPSGSGYKTFTVERVAANGEKYYVTFHMKKGEFENAVKKYNKNIEKLRKERAGQIVHGFRQRVAEATQNRNYYTNIVNNISSNFTKDEIRALENEGLISRTAGRISGFEEAIVKGWADPFEVSGTEAEQKAAKAKNKLRRAYNRQMRNVDRSLINAYSGVPSFETYDRQVAEAYTQNERLAKINKIFAEKYKGVIEGGNPLIERKPEVSTEVSAEAKKAAENFAENETKSLKETMEAKEKALNEAKASKGTVDETAKKAAEEAKNKAKGEFDKAVSDITAKYGKGKWKIAAPVIGALALGAAGWLAGHSDEA